MTTGILGKKLGMSQVFDTAGKVIPVTVIEAGPCTVIQRKTARIDGYDAVQIGFRQTKAAKVGKPMLGHFQKAGKGTFSALQEIRVEAAEPLDIGAEIKVDIFKEGDVVDVMGHSKGRGFTGVMKRWNFRGGPATHGSMHHRAPGSIGASAYPSRVIKNMKMAGQYGNERVTILNLRVVGVEPEKNLLLVRGAVPGAKNGLVYIRRAVKKPA
ncbi:MAG: 50S ribosomal protein L3 [Deltaproteobacteria bacterium]|nr:MAG: 50S ribosomal protein L3 [Deltaproteobacteria bacterium]